MSLTYLTSRRLCRSCGGQQMRIARRLIDRILFCITLGFLRRSRYQCMQCGREETVGVNDAELAAPKSRGSE